MLFCAELSGFKNVYQLIKAITFEELAIIYPLEEGMRITLNDMKCSETTAYIPKVLFKSYTVNSTEEFFFKINLKVLTECLNVCGEDGNSTLKMTYDRVDGPLRIIVKHSCQNVTVDCEIPTYRTDEPQSILTEPEEENTCKIMMTAEILGILLLELDIYSDVLKIEVSPEEPCVKLTATGAAAVSYTSMSKDGELLLVFKCTQRIQFEYAYSHIRKLNKVVNQANKVSMAITPSGVLHFQLGIMSDSHHMFVEHSIGALYDEGD